MADNWFVYIVQCANNTFYTGMTNDVEKRVAAHNTGRGAAYTRTFGPVQLVWHIPCVSRTEALKLEYRVKQLSRVQKERLVAGKLQLLTENTVPSRQLIDAVKKSAAAILSGEHTGHDWQHALRVEKNALEIAAREKCDACVVCLAALLHDIADWKFNGGDFSAGPLLARKLLLEAGAVEPVIEHVCRIIGEVSYKGAGVATKPTSIEGKIVQDADRLDAMGAIGIARTFAYGGAKGRELYDPASAPVLHKTKAAYMKSQSCTINHFYEKLLLLRDRMNTRTGRRLAAARHRYMEDFLRRFFSECGAPAWKLITYKKSKTGKRK